MSTTYLALQAVIGRESAPVVMHVWRDRLLAFAAATGQSDPRYTDVEAARSLGEPDMLVPPTFLFSVEMEQPDPFEWLTSLGVDMTTVLHAGQSFNYLAPAHAGDTLTARSSITDVRRRKGGALVLVERRTDVTRGSARIARLRMTMAVVRA